MRILGLVASLALCLVPLASEPLPTSPPALEYSLYENELTRLLAISTRLASLSAALESKLAISEASLTRLETELSELRQRLESSGERLTELEGLLVKAESSLESLKKSFAEYKAEAERQAKARSRELWATRAAAIALFFLALIGFAS